MSILVRGVYVKFGIEHFERDFPRFDPITGEKRLVRSKYPEVSLTVGGKAIMLPRETLTFEELKIALNLSVEVKTDMAYSPASFNFDSYFIPSYLHKKIHETFTPLGVSENPFDRGALGYWIDYDELGAIVGVRLVAPEEHEEVTWRLVSTDEIQKTDKQFQKLSTKFAEFFGLKLKSDLFFVDP